MKHAKRPRGRPTIYSEDLTETICERIALGSTLREICRDEAMPDRVTIYRWLERYDSFRNRYARACEFRAENWADELIEISDDGSNDWMAKLDREGRPTGFYALNKEAVMRSKLRVETRQWMMERAAPKKYGAKVLPDSDDASTVARAIKSALDEIDQTVGSLH